MTRKLIAAVVAATIGLGFSAQAMAGDWNHRPDGADWRDHRHHGWEQGNHYGWRDRNHDGRVDWRDRPHLRDYNHDGRIDWRDRRILQRYDRNHDGVLDRRDRRF